MRPAARETLRTARLGCSGSSIAAASYAEFRRIRQRPVRPTDCSGSCCASPLGARAAPTATSGCASGRCRPVAAGSGAKSGASKCRPRRSSTRAAACSAETAQVTLYEYNFRVLSTRRHALRTAPATGKVDSMIRHTDERASQRRDTGGVRDVRHSASRRVASAQVPRCAQLCFRSAPPIAPLAFARSICSGVGTARPQTTPARSSPFKMAYVRSHSCQLRPWRADQGNA